MSEQETIKPTVMIVDDEASIRKVFSLVLQDICQIITAAEAFEALSKLKDTRIDVVLLDIRLPGIDGVEVLRRIKEYDPEIQVIMVTGVKELDVAVKAIKLGAYDYITKPFDVDELRALVLEVLSLKKDLYTFKEFSFFPTEFFLRGESDNFNKLLREIEKNVDSPGNVLITGEIGTEKELVAKEICARSLRKGNPPIQINFFYSQTETVEKKFLEKFFPRIKAGSGGSVICRGVETLPLELQQQLFEFLTEDPRPEVRILTITDRDLKELVEKGLFREDLFYILSLSVINPPPLRERGDDVLFLFGEYLKKFNLIYNRRLTKIPEKFTELLRNYRWPGNILELATLVENLVLTNQEEEISLAQCPLKFFAGIKGPEPLKKEIFSEAILKKLFRKIMARQVLEASAGEPAKTARLLDVSSEELENILKE